MKARIVVVEDENLVALAIEKSLRNMGYEVPLTTPRGEEALQRMPELEPDLVLMDIRLKGALDGIEAADRIRTSFNIPVIFLTAHADGPTLERAKVTEPFGYILKPFEEKSLQAAIEMTLYKARTQAQLRRTKEKLETILDCIVEGVIVSGINAVVEFINPAARRMLLGGGTPSPGTTLARIFSVTDAGSGTKVILPVSQVIMDRKKIRITNLLLTVVDGSQVPIDCSLAPLRDENDITWGIVIVFAETSGSRKIPAPA